MEERRKLFPPYLCPWCDTDNSLWVQPQTIKIRNKEITVIKMFCDFCRYHGVYPFQKSLMVVHYYGALVDFVELGKQKLFRPTDRYGLETVCTLGIVEVG